jgi:hypothetical protein
VVAVATTEVVNVEETVVPVGRRTVLRSASQPIIEIDNIKVK